MTDVLFVFGITDIVDFYLNNYWIETLQYFLVFVITFLIAFLWQRFNNKKVLLSLILSLITVYSIIHLWTNTEIKIEEISDQCVRLCVPNAKKVFNEVRNYCPLGEPCTRMPDYFFYSFCYKKCESFEKELFKSN